MKNELGVSVIVRMNIYLLGYTSRLTSDDPGRCLVPVVVIAFGWIRSTSPFRCWRSAQFLHSLAHLGSGSSPQQLCAPCHSAGSSVPDTWHFGVDPDPAIFVIDLQDANMKLIFLTSFSAYYSLRYIYIIFKDKKIQKKSQNSRNQGFSYYFCLLIEGSGSGSIPLTNGSGSDPGGPKACGSGTLGGSIHFLFCVVEISGAGEQLGHDPPAGRHGQLPPQQAAPTTHRCSRIICSCESTSTWKGLGHEIEFKYFD